MNFNIELLSNTIAAIALMISLFSYFEARRTRIECGRAYLIIELMQIDSKLYILLSNIGNTYAYDLEIIMDDKYINNFAHLDTIRPSCSYRYCLLNSSDVCVYPDTLNVTLKYRDCYNSLFKNKKLFVFNVIEYLKFDMVNNTEYACYDINNPI